MAWSVAAGAAMKKKKTRDDLLAAVLGAATALEKLARAVAAAIEDEPWRADRMLPVTEAAQLAGVSKRVLQEAIRRSALPAYGTQRTRTVKPRDLERWVDSRRLRPAVGPDDADIERRVQRLGRRAAAHVDDSRLSLDDNVRVELGLRPKGGSRST